MLFWIRFFIHPRVRCYSERKSTLTMKHESKRSENKESFVYEITVVDVCVVFLIIERKLF
jgi:hypothetical protein